MFKCSLFCEVDLFEVLRIDEVLVGLGTNARIWNKSCTHKIKNEKNQMTAEELGTTARDVLDSKMKMITWDKRHAPITTTRTVICKDRY